MKKYWITALLTVIAIFAIVGTIAAVSANTNGTLALNAADSGKQITVNAGDSFTLTLDSNVTTGFSWSNASISNASVLQETSHEYITPPTPRIGQGGHEKWTFKALAEGTNTISMNYSRSWETGVAPAATFNVTIVVQ